MNEAQKKQMVDLANQIYGLMKDSVKDLWREEDEHFLRTLANDVAQQKALAEISDKPEEHIKNIEHLAVTLQGEIVRKGLKVRAFRRDLFLKVLTTIIRTVAVPLLRAVIQKG